MGPTARAQFVYNRRRRRSGGRHAVEEASDEEEQRQDSSSSSEDEEDEAEASGEEVADDDDEEAAVEPAAEEDPAAAAAGEKRGGRKGRITISLKKVCKVLVGATNLISGFSCSFSSYFCSVLSIYVQKDDPRWCFEPNLNFGAKVFLLLAVGCGRLWERMLPLVLGAKLGFGDVKSVRW